MSLLTDCNPGTTTVLQIIQNAEAHQTDCFDVMHLSLDSGRDLILVAITAEYLDPVAKLLEGLREMREQ